MNIGFIGTGKIAGAVVESICTSDMTDYKIFLSPRNKENSDRLAAKFARVHKKDSNQDVVDESDLVFIALRPNIFKEVVENLEFRVDQSIISLIPFSSYNDLKDLVKPALNISRATPLPTVVTHKCPIPVYKPSPSALEVLKCIGQPFEVHSEEELHTIWTLTCLISPFYDMMSSLSSWSVENSVDKEVADKYVADMFHTLAYAAHLQTNPDFSILSHHAATPGGLNERTAKEIKLSGAHESYVKAANGILKLFSS